MILDTLQSGERYLPLHPGFLRAFEFLRSEDAKALKPGRYDVEGARLYALVAQDAGRGMEGAVLEAHRRYIDIQFCSEGVERIGWKNVRDCIAPRGDYDESKDIAFFNDAPETWVSVGAGRFAIFFPKDAHAPLAGEGSVRKIVMKIAVAEE